MFNKLRQRLHIREKIRISEKKMWDVEFLRSKYKAMREGFRVEYDRLNENKTALQVRIDKLTERNGAEDAKEIEQVKTIIAGLDKDLNQLKSQMDGIDKQIEGYDDPQEGRIQGIDETIDGYRGVIGLLKEYKSKL